MRYYSGKEIPTGRFRLRDERANKAGRIQSAGMSGTARPPHRRIEWYITRTQGIVAFLVPTDLASQG